MIKCLIVDDEPLALDLLEDNIRRIPFLELRAKLRNPLEAVELLKKEKIDLLFLDIQMPGITGVQFLKTLKDPPMVIFVTAYEKHALEGFELNVVDFLLKPVSFERFLKAVSKANDLYVLKEQATTENAKASDHFFVHSEYKLTKIMFKDILYIEGLKDYVKIFTVGNAKPLLTRLNLKQIEEKLSSGKFFRVHKSYIVSIDTIKSVKKTTIYIGDNEIPIGDNYKEDFFRLLGAEKL